MSPPPFAWCILRRDDGLLILNSVAFENILGQNGLRGKMEARTGTPT